MGHSLFAAPEESAKGLGEEHTSFLACQRKRGKNEAQSNTHDLSGYAVTYSFYFYNQEGPLIH